MTHAETEVYRVARGVLLDALSALRPHHRAVVVVGAQGVYLRTLEVQVGVAPYTFDADLLVAPDLLEDRPDLAEAMRGAGFHLATDPDGNMRPGEWIAARELGGRRQSIPVDLLVPVSATGSRRRSAPLSGHTRGAARNVRGLEAALLDHSPMEVRALDEEDPRALTVNVAGTVALLIAKAFKIHERVRRTDRPDRVNDKDAGDVYRLMQASDAVTSMEVARTLVAHEAFGEVCREGLDHLVQLFRASRTPGTALAAEHLRAAVPGDRVTAVCETFTGRLREVLG